MIRNMRETWAGKVSHYSVNENPAGMDSVAIHTRAV
jgi:hypothetical protein